MNSNKKKILTGACYAVLVILAGWAVLVLLQLLRWTDLIDINIGLGSQIGRLAWASDLKALTIQRVEIIGYMASSLVLIALAFILVVNCMKGIKSKRLFSHKSTITLWAITCVSFFFELFSSNLSILFGSRQISFGSNLIVTPLILLLFTLLYDTAVSIAAENELTI